MELIVPTHLHRVPETETSCWIRFDYWQGHKETVPFTVSFFARKAKKPYIQRTTVAVGRPIPDSGGGRGRKEGDLFIELKFGN